MDRILFWLYTIIVHAGNIYIFLGCIFSEKLRLLNSGRQTTWKTLEKLSLGREKKVDPVNQKKDKDDRRFANVEQTKDGLNIRDVKYGKRVWIHCASLGEFEQGRPVIEKIKLNHPECFIALSFFSPSGYEIQKNYDKADVIFYLPADTPDNCIRLLKLIRPDVMIFVKYEFWWNLIRVLVRNKVKIFLISGIFRKNDYFLKTIFRPFLTLLRGYKMIFLQDKTSHDIMAEHNVSNTMISGDTRIDRAIQRSKGSDVPTAIKEYVGEKKVIIYGSVWKSDMALVLNCIDRFSEFVHIIAPHDIATANVNKLMNLIQAEVCLYSDDKWLGKILIINNIGMLGSLYSLSKYAYVGGGFQQGIHNILEPAVFNVPVFFGPHHKKFNEAILLQAENIAYSVSDSTKMIETIIKFEKSEVEYSLLSKRANAFFERSKGATEKTVSYISTYL